MKQDTGFTLIELVLVIIVLAVLSATAIPRLMGKQAFEAQAYRDQLQQLLKTVQLQAMSCDPKSDCHKKRKANLYSCNKVVITATRFGIPTSCGNSLPSTFAATHFGMSSEEAKNSSIRFSPHTISFNKWGIPTCSGGCNISIFGEATLSLIIESQGYIHEG